MKNTFLKMLAIALVAVLCVGLVACGSNPSGTYRSADDVTLTFSGDEVTLSWKGLTQTNTLSGTYEIREDENGGKTITFTMEKGESGSILGDWANAAVKAIVDGTKSYVTGKDDNGSYIEIGGTKYYKQ